MSIKLILSLFILLCSFRLLITGCGRSGTSYMAEFLEKSGYDIHHERKGQHGCVSWPMAVNYYSPWTRSDGVSFTHIFHQVRHPLDVITSWYVNIADLDRDEWIFVRRHLPQIHRSDSLLVHCVKYWYYWNLLVEEQAQWRYRIEDIEQILPEFIARSGLKLKPGVLARISKNYNSLSKIYYRLPWTQLKKELPGDLYENLITMSIRYGYLENFVGF